MALRKVLAMSLFAGTEAKVNVLVFGDSFGDTGPTYHVVQDMFDLHKIDANVQSSAIGGTAACQWAGMDQGNEMVKQVQKLFPDAQDGPDYVWYTMGANDQWQDGSFQSCLKQSASDADAQACAEAESDRIFACTTKMLDNFWSVFPKSKVLQTGYEVPCQDFLCQDTVDRVFYGNYCKNNITCSNHIGYNFQTYHMDSLKTRYPNKPYNSISIIGAAQKAAGIPGADVGKPNFDKGAKCEWTTFCCHPKYGSPAGDAWRDAFWDLYFSNEFPAEKVAVSV